MTIDIAPVPVQLSQLSPSRVTSLSSYHAKALSLHRDSHDDQRLSLDAPSNDAMCQAPTIACLPVIFLDVDGVLHSLFGDDIFAEGCCSLLEELVRATGSMLVLSSTWRLEADNFAVLNQMLLGRGLPAIREVTKDIGRHREEEICEWLDRHPWVTNWIAIDDLNLTARPNIHAKRLCGHFVRTNSKVGLVREDIVLAKSLLLTSDSVPVVPNGAVTSKTNCLSSNQVAQHVAKRCGPQMAHAAASAGQLDEQWSASERCPAT